MAKRLRLTFVGSRADLHETDVQLHGVSYALARILHYSRSKLSDDDRARDKRDGADGGRARRLPKRLPEVLQGDEARWRSCLGLSVPAARSAQRSLPQGRG